MLWFQSSYKTIYRWAFKGKNGGFIAFIYCDGAHYVSRGPDKIRKRIKYSSISNIYSRKAG